MARLIYTDSSNSERSVYLGPDQPLVKIGRASDCSIRTSRQSVSRHHAEFRYVEGTYEVTDLNSSNGTWLIEDDQRFEISHERLEDGDEIWCGDFIVHFSLHDLPVDDPTAGIPKGMSSGQFGAPVAPQPQARPVAAGGDFSDYGQVDFEEFGAEELAAAPAGRHRMTPTVGAGPPGFDEHAELARLREAKRSVEELASRQTFEITDLQAQVEALTKRVEAGDEQTRAQLQAAQQAFQELQQENAELREALEANARELEQLREKASDGADSAELQAELKAALGRCDALQADNDELSQAVEDAQAQVDARDAQLAELQAELERALAELARAPQVDADSLQEELEQGKRLLSEYERRNADLRLEFDAQRDVNAALRVAYEGAQADLEQAQQARDEAQKLLAVAEPARQQLEQARAELASAEQLCEDLRAEVQGLKQRVQLERRRSRQEGDTEASEQLQAELAAAQARIAELEASPSGEPAQGLVPQRVQQLRERLGALERLTDAIARADLEPLSTVDRIRLQSAIRETDPKATLQGALELLD